MTTETEILPADWDEVKSPRPSDAQWQRNKAYPPRGGPQNCLRARWPRQAPGGGLVEHRRKGELAGKIASYCMSNNIGRKERLFPISRVWIYKILQKAGERAGIEKDRCHPHVFRHGFAVNAALSGVPPLVLRQWLGHASIDSTLAH